MSQNSNISYLNFLKKSGVSSFLQNKPNIFYKGKSNKKNNLINLDISEVKNLNDLEQLIINTNYFKSRKLSNNSVIGEGNQKAKIFIIGEFPVEENQKIKIFSYESEKLLNKMLNSINLNRENIYTTNIIKWPIDKNKKIENKDILNSLPIIQRQIELIKPKIIFLMGSIAAKAILNSNLDINKLRGKWHNYKSINLDKSIECLVTYHPAQLIKFNEKKKYAWEDLQMFQKKINNEIL